MKAKIGIHHTGGLGNDNNASSKHLTLKHIDAAHKARWPEFKSTLGYWVGYSLLIFPDGKKLQTRAVGEETGAAKGSNFDAFHICLVGNFNKFSSDRPTKEQITALKEVMLELIRGSRKDIVSIGTGKSWIFSDDRIYPHRVLQPNHTDCNGTSLVDNWAKELVKESLVEPPKETVYTISTSGIRELVEVIYQAIIAFLEKRKFGRMKYDISDRDDIGIDYSKFTS